MGLWSSGLVCFATLVYFLAQYKIFFTAPKEGSAEFVVAGNTVKRMIMAWSGHSERGPDDIEHAHEQFQIVEEEATQPPWHYLNPLNWMEPFGIYWIGVWPFYQNYRYDFVWTEEKVDEHGKIVPFTRRAQKATDEGQTPYIKINDTNYFFVVDDVKTNGGVPLKFVLVVTIRIENPYKALFSGADWLERTGGTINNMVIRYAGALSYEQITKSEPAFLKVFKDGAVQSEAFYSLEDLIKMLGDEKPDDVTGTDLLLKYGVRIVAAKIHSFDFADATGAQQFRDATTAKYVAEQRGLGEEAEAKGKAAATRLLAEAEKYRIETTYGPIAGDDKDKRMQIRQLEATEKSGSQGGNTIVVPDELLGLARRFTQK